MELDTKPRPTLKQWLEQTIEHRHPLVRWAKANSIPIKNVCADLGVSRPTLYNWDWGNKAPRRYTLQKIVEYTKGAVTVEDCHAHWLLQQGDK